MAKYVERIGTEKQSWEKQGQFRESQKILTACLSCVIVLIDMISFHPHHAGDRHVIHISQRRKWQPGKIKEAVKCHATSIRC